MKEEIEEIETKKPYREFPLFYECFKKYFRREKAYCAIIVLKNINGISIYPSKPGLVILKNQIEEFPTLHQKGEIDVIITTFLYRKEDIDCQPCFIEVSYVTENGAEIIIDEMIIGYSKNLDLVEETPPAVWCKGLFYDCESSKIFWSMVFFCCSVVALPNPPKILSLVSLSPQYSSLIAHQSIQ